MVGVEHPNVRSTHRCKQVRIIWGILPAVRGRDERSVMASTSKYDVARLVADKQCLDDTRCVRITHVDDADRVGQVIDDPNLRVGARCDGDWLQTDDHRTSRFQPIAMHAKDFEAIIRRICRKQQPAVRRER